MTVTALKVENASRVAKPPATVVALAVKRPLRTSRARRSPRRDRSARHSADRRPRHLSVRLADTVRKARVVAAAALARAGRHLGTDHRSVLRPRWHRQGPLLASLREPAARRRRLRAGGGRRHRARHAGRPVGVGHARARSHVPGAADGAAAGVAAAVARRVPRRAALRDLRDLHHGDLADHHQHGRRHPQHPAGLPQRGCRAAAQPRSSSSARS